MARCFFIGHYGGFDRMVAKAVAQMKERYPQIILSMLIPYHPAERPIPLFKGFDGTIYPPNMERVPRRLAIVLANRYMVDHAGYLIAYVCHPASNASNLVDYAKKRESKNQIRVTLLSHFK